MQRWKYLIPNGLTALSMLLGLNSIYLSSKGQFVLAAWFILWGVLLDKLDGAAARLLNACSNFGLQYDSFADFVVFGIAPPSLLYFLLSSQTDFQAGAPKIVLAIAVGLFVISASSRLANFNIDVRCTSSDLFFGFPTTFAGATIASGYLTWERYGDSPLPGWLCIAFLVSASIAMNSPVRLPKLKLRGHIVRRVFVATNILCVYIVTTLRLVPEYLFGLCLTYIVYGTAWGLFQRDLDKTETPNTIAPLRS